MDAPCYLRVVSLEFEKWEGTGNDFVLVDRRQEGRLPDRWSDEEVARLCNRKLGVGADGVLIVGLGNQNRLEVDFRNPDGSRSFCGNGTRSALAWAFEKGLVGPEVDISAVDGMHHGRILDDEMPGITMNVLNAPEECSSLIPSAVHASFTHSGSPHHVEWLQYRHELERLDLNKVAQPIRRHECYAPEGCNVNVVVSHEGSLWIRTFERGVENETLSCGTGVVAAALGEFNRQNVHAGTHDMDVHARGGTLKVRADIGPHGECSNVWLMGKARKVFAGKFWIALMALMWCCVPAFGSAFELGPLSNSARISVLTASPGSDLYAAFGHSAIRLTDPESDLDVVFNYGTFTVNEDFYIDFVRGRMDYQLGVQPFSRFKDSYRRQERALFEQVLNLERKDVDAVAAYLKNNVQPENAVYAYDFFRDNCATRVVKVFDDVLGDRLVMDCNPSDSTYLEALRPYTAGLPWVAWGMELILGLEASEAMPSCGHAFLPDVLAHQLKSATLDGKPFCQDRTNVLSSSKQWHSGIPERAPGRSAPLWAMWGWAVWMFLIWRLPMAPSTLKSIVVWMSLAVNWLMSMTLTLLFLAMAMFTDHNDTWWNADLVWVSGSVCMLWLWIRWLRGRMSAGSRRERIAVSIWTALSAWAVLVNPWVRSELAWGQSLVWPTIGACLAVIMSVWLLLDVTSKPRSNVGYA